MFTLNPFKQVQREDSLSFKMEEYRKFLEKQIQNLDEKTNSVLCRLGEYFFNSSNKVKTEIFLQSKKVHGSSIIQKDIQESIYQIEYSVSTFIDLADELLTHTKQNLEKQQFSNMKYNNIQTTDFNRDKDQNPLFNQANLKDQINIEDQGLLQKSDDPRVSGQSCPVCQKFFSNGQTFVKHLKLHEIDLQSQGFDCPQCDVSFSQCKLLLSHLYKRHYILEDYQQNKRKSYFCPFTEQKFYKHQSAQLSHVIRSSPHYSKALDQLQENQLSQKKQKNNYPLSEKLKLSIKQKVPEFIRGVTKGIQISKKLFACPLCGLEEFETLKYVGGHIRNAHRVLFRNNLCCPECHRETRSAYDLAVHLISIHGIIKETSEGGGRRQIYTTVGGILFDDFIKLSRHLINDADYLTLFMSRCSDKPQAFLKKNREQRKNVKDKQVDLSKDDSSFFFIA